MKNHYLKTTCTAAFLCFFALGAHAQGIKGTINSEGEPLPFATIFIEELGTGTSSNRDGYFEYRLAPGAYRVQFKYMGYQSVTKEIVVKEQFETLDIELAPTVVQLREIEVAARREDPAYTVIRKAIAKSKYHTLQLDSYTAEVYIKGGGQLKKIPFYLKKEMKKEGIDTSTVYLTESISKVTYTRPNTYKEEVISIRQTGDDNSTSPNGFIQGSFYEPEIATAVSPLSPRALAYYRFQYLGSFFDGEHEINKIRVVPRVRGEDVFEGEIYIVEGLWCIHSVDLRTRKLGFDIAIKQIYAPVAESVWMPINHKIGVEGGILGIRVAYEYLATLSNYTLTLNPDLEVEKMLVIDEKIEREAAKEIEKSTGGLLNENTEAIFSEKEEFTRKELRKTLRKYEKEMLEAADDLPDSVTFAYSQIKIDSNAYIRDSAYWATMRPVPLREVEVRSYQKLDSIAFAEKAKREEAEADTTTNKSGSKKKKGFDLNSVLTGHTFKLGKYTRLKYVSPLTQIEFNTVEG